MRGGCALPGLAGTALLLASLAVPVSHAAPADPRVLSGDPAALEQLVGAVSLDVMSEASLEACEQVGAPSFDALRDAWVAWRERHGLAALRQVVASLKRQARKDTPWATLTDPLRARVLADPAPDQVCAALLRDWQSPAMDASAMFPLAAATAAAVVQAGLARAPQRPAVLTQRMAGPVLLPSQIAALSDQQQGGWSALSDEMAERRLGWVFVKGRVQRWSRDPDRFRLVQDQGERISQAAARLEFDAEPWVGREIVVRGLVTSLRDYGLTLSAAALLTDAAGLAPSPLPQQPLGRKPVLLQRVMRAPGAGLPDTALAAVVIHGESDYSDGTRWREDVRYLLKDGTVYRRTELPPDQLDVAASRKLEPQQWGRWRQEGKGYAMQAQDVDGRPVGDFKPQHHHAVRPWPRDTRLEGYFSRSSFDGSLALGGVSSTHAIRFTRDGRFERSGHAFGASGGMAAMNGAAISATSRADGSGSSSTAGGTVSGMGGTAGASSSTNRDDGASRRGRYQLAGYALTLEYDDGHRERLLSFPVYGDDKTIYVGGGSLVRSDR
jgi:hypothetical protein